MGLLGKVTIKQSKDYKKLSDISDIVLEDGKTYVLQVQNSLTIASSAEMPTVDGFYINNPTPFTFTKVAGEDLWLHCSAFIGYLVISE